MAIITKEWIDAHDAVIQQKLQPLADVKIVRTLPSKPQNWESLLTYSIDNKTYSFKIGDEVRIPDVESETGYIYYKLYAIDDNEAQWAKLGTGEESSLSATITVNLEAYSNNVKNSGADLAGTVVTLSDGVDSVTSTLESGQTAVVFTGVIPLKNYTVSVSQVTGYTQPASQTITNIDFAADEVLTFQYYADEYILSATSNQGSDSTIAGVNATISYGGSSATAIGTYKVPQGTEVTVAFPDVTGYKKTVTNVGKAYTAAYETEIVYVTLAIETDADISEATFTIKDGNDNTLGTGESGDSVKIPYDTTYTVSASVLSGCQVEDASYTASQVTRNVTLNYIEEIKGVYAYYSDGSLRTIENADSNAIGVAVVDDACSFVIGKSDNYKQFGGYNRNLSNAGVSGNVYDYKGIDNTTRVINACAEYTDSTYSITGAPAAEWCRTQFSGKGYLPSVKEFMTAYPYKTEIAAVMSSISGSNLINSNYWSSTMGSSATTTTYTMAWNGGTSPAASREAYKQVRAFSSLYIPVTFTLSSSDNTSISGRTVYVIDRTNEVLELTTDSNGQATGMVALGNVEIRVAGSRTLTKSITLEATMHNVTVEICTPEPGVFAYYADGSMRGYDDADTNAIGVAVVTSNCSFVIDKTNIARGSAPSDRSGKDLSEVATTTSNKSIAQTDFQGEINSIRIIEFCCGYIDNNGSTKSATGFESCKAAFSGKGYMGALGEWYTAYQNKTNVDSMITKIGGTPPAYTYSSSTNYFASNWIITGEWTLDWGNGTIDKDSRNVSYHIRAFCAL